MPADRIMEGSYANVSWPAVNTSRSYVIDWRATVEEGFNRRGGGTTAGTSYFIKTEKGWRTLDVTVTAYLMNGDKRTWRSFFDIVKKEENPPPAKPSTIRVSKKNAAIGEQITVFWEIGVDATEYRIVRYVNGVRDSFLYTGKSAVSSRTDTMQSGWRWVEYVVDYEVGGSYQMNQLRSEKVTISQPPPKPPKPRPQNPATLRVSKTRAKAGDQITISWDSASYASEYRLYRSVDGQSQERIHTCGGSGSYTDRMQEGWKTVRYFMDTAGNGQASSGYTTSETVTILSNQAPVISGSDQDLGSKSDAFQVTYSVSDANAEDSITVIERLSGTVLNTKQNVARDTAQTVEITAEKLSTLPLGNTQTIEIEAIDSSGNRSYRRYYFRRTNTPPKISGEDTNLGVKSVPFEVRFTATEQENEAMTGKILLNGKVVKEYAQVVAGQEYSFTLPKLEFAQLNAKDTHRLIIEVKDASGSIARRVYSFVRAVSRIYYEFKKETTKKVSVVMVTPNWHIAEGAIQKVEACNNALDEAPTWEDITAAVEEKKYHSFTNQTKTAEKWALGVRLEVKKGAATEISYLVGIGGAYK